MSAGPGQRLTTALWTQNPKAAPTVPDCPPRTSTSKPPDAVECLGDGRDGRDCSQLITSTSEQDGVKFKSSEQ